MKRAVLCGLILLCACTGDKHVPAAPGVKHEDSGTGGEGGNRSYDDKDSGRDSGSVTVPVDPLAPSVTFTAPVPARDPNTDEVLSDGTVTVRCKIEASSLPAAAAVDKSAVKIQLQHADDPNGYTDSTPAAIAENEYQAVFDLSGYPNGPVTFKCTGRDLTKHMGSASLTTLLDLGPKITVTKPVDKQTYALKTPMAIEFQVSPSPLNDSDNEAKVKSVVLTVGGVETPVSESTTTPGLYQTSIDFSDKNKFPVQPTSAQLQFLASNARTPVAPTRNVRADVTIDGNGPSIAVMSPETGTIQHGNVQLVLMVTDPSGIKPESLIATINTKPYSNWAGTVPKFTQTFDTRDIDKKNELTQLTINITAIDNVGNKTDPPVSHLIRLDNLPPVISLDPPLIRETRESNNHKYCSQAFDPVGDYSANDLETVYPGVVFRALVEDHTNSTRGTVFNYLSGTNQASVAVYTQGLIELPLLVDTNNDGICDAINKSDDVSIRPEERVTADKDPVKIKLDPVTPGGSSWFAKPSTVGTFDDPACPSDPSGADIKPLFMCDGADMWRVVPGRIQGKPAAVYAVTPSNSNTSGACNGSNWEIRGNTRGREGWVCVAARVEDMIKNVGVSAPLRLCFDDDDPGNGAPICPVPAPSCTDGCTISAAQKFEEGGIWPLK